MKTRIKRMLILIKTLFKYGFSSYRKRRQHFKNENSFSLEDIQKIHIVSKEDLEKQSKEKFQNSFKFSIITPLYNTPENFLIELIQSLQNQTYSNWELCLADGSDEQHTYVGNICREYSVKDSRIVYHKLKENKGISENTNECIKLATGQYYGLLDHDDLLHPSALYEVCKAINEHKADFLYTDEVKFSESIEKISDLKAFNLKPGFGIDDLRSHNYICHFTVFNKNLLDGEERLYRSEYDGSQDHDMVLRLTEKAKKIYHINKVLYYWRVHSNSVSMNLDVKSYAVDSAIRAISDQLKRQNEKGVVMSSEPFRTIYKVEYPIVEKPLISVILWNIRSLKVAQQARSIIKKYSSYENFEFIYLSESEQNNQCEDIIAVYCEGNIPQKINYAIRLAKGKFILMLNGNLKFMTEQWIQELLMHAQRANIGTVGAKVYNKDASVRCAGISLSDKYEDYLYHLGQENYQNEIGYEAMLCHVRNVTANSKDCLLFSKKVWEMIDGFSNTLPEYFDVDFCLKANKKGYRNVWVPYSEVFLSDESKQKKTLQQINLFHEKWQSQIDFDEHMNKIWNQYKLV